MTHDLVVGARPAHEGGMLRLGLEQLAESEAQLRNLLATYERSKNPRLAREIARECVFISSTLDALIEMACSQPGAAGFVASGCLLRVSRYLCRLIEDAERIVTGSRSRLP